MKNLESNCQVSSFVMPTKLDEPSLFLRSRMGGSSSLVKRKRRGTAEEERRHSELKANLKRIRSEGKAKENWTRIGFESEVERTCFLQVEELR